uniref:Transmembrane protein n=1 Tax=Kalanchoe fedtschenkoi TaxID=63787 RepID=A0A7N1A7D8_KALFE
MGTWRRRLGRAEADDDNLTLPTTDDSWPIETHEQEELVKSFEQIHHRQSRIWRRYHAYFENEVDSMSVIFLDGIAIIACALAIYGLSGDFKYEKRYLLSSTFLAIMVAMLWLYQMLRLPKFRWDVIWLAVAPLCCSLLSLYVTHLLVESRDEVHKLRAAMYEYKRR